MPEHASGRSMPTPMIGACQLSEHANVLSSRIVLQSITPKGNPISPDRFIHQNSVYPQIVKTSLYMASQPTLVYTEDRKSTVGAGSNRHLQQACHNYIGHYYIGHNYVGHNYKAITMEGVQRFGQAQVDVSAAGLKLGGLDLKKSIKINGFGSFLNPAPVVTRSSVVKKMAST